MRRVGILGGMGPEATVLLMQRIISATPAADDADHLPLIVDQNPQVPSRIRHIIEGTGDDPGPVLAAMARRLQDAGAQALAMPCNTAHHYAPAIRQATAIPFLDMVALSVVHAARLVGKGGKVGLLASPAVRKIGLFDRPLADAGLIAAYASDEDAMLSAIRLIKSRGVTDEARAVLAAASSELLAGGATVQLVACTEFSLVSDFATPDVSLIDTLDLLVSEIIAFATSDGINADMAERNPPTKSANARDPHTNKETTK
jgi:aspartate racemase